MVTAQNVTVHYQVAGLGARVLAFIVDRVVLVAYQIIVFLLLELFDVHADWLYIVLIAVPNLFYFLVCELVMNGQSVGKLAMKIKVARLDGSQPDIWNYLLRWVLRPIDTTLGLAFVLIAFSQKSQRLGDMAAGTTVISLKQRVTLKDTMLVDVPDDHKLSFVQVRDLSDRQAELIKEVLYGNQGTNRWELVDQMADKVKAHLNVESELKNYQFLQTILADFVAYTSE